MNTLLYLAQSYSTEYDSYSSYDSSASDEAVALFILGIWGFFMILSIAVYVATSLGLMKIFDKAGVPGWMAWVPFLNNWKMLEIGGQQGFWAVLSIIPVINIASAIFIYIAMYHISKKLGKDGVFILWALFFTPVWFLWLGFDKSTWNEAAASAPSLHQ